ncbi:hypothetical protein P9969_012275 [Citrobacter amalonaticus]|nr:hypothetical protein [Citrobacter amalonaticus]MEC5724285.1 hypothetical protein [Citrobacter amalonaticus]
MSFFKFVIIVICFHAFSVFAGTIDCEPDSEWTTIHTDFELKPSGTNISLGNNISDWSVLYSFKGVVVGVQQGSCSSSFNTAYLYSSSHTVLLNTVSGSKIYETNVSGIGMSIAVYDSYSARHELGPYPDFDSVGYEYYYRGTWLRADISFWKIPGQIPMTGGPITIDGPEIGIVYYNSTNTITSADVSRIVPFSGGAGGTGYLAGSRILHATLMFQPGTCNIEGDNVNVDMGDYDGTGGHSLWKDASFKLICPNGYGYGGSYTGPANGTQEVFSYPYSVSPDGTVAKNNVSNGRVQISIVPYTETLDANRGIIALDGTGAQGYGIQLAWGDYSTQNLAEPSKPVIVNSYVDAHSLNAAFSADDTPIGGNGLVGLDNTIKMAARYIHTTGKTQPGPANAVVQVIANYQ